MPTSSTGAPLVREERGGSLEWPSSWIENICSDTIRMLAIGGGAITICECQMALALGESVAVVEVADSEVGKWLADHPWSTNPLLQRLPVDPGVLRAFLQQT